MWAPLGTIYDLNDPTISGDNCTYYATNIRSQLMDPHKGNFTSADLARIDSLVGYNSSNTPLRCFDNASHCTVERCAFRRTLDGHWISSGLIRLNTTICSINWRNHHRRAERRHARQPYQHTDGQH